MTIHLLTCLEPSGLALDKNLKPDSVSTSPWQQRKPLEWDVTHPLAQSWLPIAQRDVSTEATAVESKKRAKYSALEDNSFDGDLWWSG